MHAPADRTAKRISVEECFTRYDAIELLKSHGAKRQRAPTMMPPPGDRIAVRA